MTDKLSRRDVLKGAAAAASYVALDHLPLHAAIDPQTAAADGAMVDLVSTSGVFVPPRGRSFMKFSFDFPEPSVAFGGLLFSFRVFTFENAYALDRAAMTVSQESGSTRLRCTGLVWAGRQEDLPDSEQAPFPRTRSFVDTTMAPEMQ